MLPVEKRHDTIACTAVIAMLLLFFANLVIGWDQMANAAQAQGNKPQAELPLVGSMENLKKLLSQVEGSNYTTGEIAPMMMKQKADSSLGIRNESAQAASTAADGAYSQTNVQVEGVDEADLVKTDGEYIYQVNQQQIIVVKARPASEMKVVSRLSFDDQRFSPMELYLDSKHLVVVGSSSLETPVSVLPEAKMQACPPYYQYQQFTRVLVYDISNKADLKKIRELELEGNYLSSRKIGSAVYLLSNRSIPCFNIQEQDIDLPRYRDSAAGSAYNTIACSEIAYFPDHIYPVYIMLAGFDVDNNEKAEVKTYLGNGDNLYASDKNLYIALSRYAAARPLGAKSSAVTNTSMANPEPVQENTTVFKFSLAAAKTTYLGKGEVPGRILNQFSMDENGSYFRIATTNGQIWRNDEYTSKNNIYVLDENLNICGRLEDLAPGEKIYSTRFMGDRLYMVTFKNVDPLFVVDLSNPYKPSLLGKLKIPGYSDYLHPYDENHIIGFGKESIELKTGGDESQAYYQGMKLAVFDVTDVNNPKEMFKETIGNRGTDSELLHNHKALLFSKEKNLLAFPITVMEIARQNKVNPQGFPEYGSFSFQGAYVYNLDLNKGFQLKGRITHLDDSDYKKAGDNWYGSEKNVERIIYIGDNLYTLSPGMVKANSLTDLKQTGSLNLR
ncbi:MAG: beta-propeller domain-containing protein [Syntrophomonas sp.]